MLLLLLLIDALLFLLSVLLSIRRNYDKSIDEDLIVDAADQFFAVSNAKRTGVPPLLRTESATLCFLWDCP